jgi:hypothetical protein
VGDVLHGAAGLVGGAGHLLAGGGHGAGAVGHVAEHGAELRAHRLVAGDRRAGAGQHAVQRAGQLAQLVRAVHRHVLRGGLGRAGQVAAGRGVQPGGQPGQVLAVEPPQAVGHGLDRAHDAERDQDGQRGGEQQRDDADDDQQAGAGDGVVLLAVHRARDLGADGGIQGGRGRVAGRGQRHHVL